MSSDESYEDRLLDALFFEIFPDKYGIVNWNTPRPPREAKSTLTSKLEVNQKDKDDYGKTEPKSKFKSNYITRRSSLQNVTKNTTQFRKLDCKRELFAKPNIKKTTRNIKSLDVKGDIKYNNKKPTTLQVNKLAIVQGPKIQESSLTTRDIQVNKPDIKNEFIEEKLQTKESYKKEINMSVVSQDILQVKQLILVENSQVNISVKQENIQAIKEEVLVNTSVTTENLQEVLCENETDQHCSFIDKDIHVNKSVVVQDNLNNLPEEQNKTCEQVSVQESSDLQNIPQESNLNDNVSSKPTDIIEETTTINLQENDSKLNLTQDSSISNKTEIPEKTSLQNTTNLNQNEEQLNKPLESLELKRKVPLPDKKNDIKKLKCDVINEETEKQKDSVITNREVKEYPKRKIPRVDYQDNPFNEKILFSNRAYFRKPTPLNNNKGTKLTTGTQNNKDVNSESSVKNIIVYSCESSKKSVTVNHCTVNKVTLPPNLNTVSKQVVNSVNIPNKSITKLPQNSNINQNPVTKTYNYVTKKISPSINQTVSTIQLLAYTCNNNCCKPAFTNKCSYCNINYENKSSYINHMIAFHKCQFQNLKFTNYMALQNYIKGGIKVQNNEAHKNKFRCNFCGLHYNSYIYFVYHLNLKHKNDLKLGLLYHDTLGQTVKNSNLTNILCEKCGIMVAPLQYLEHIEFVHKCEVEYMFSAFVFQCYRVPNDLQKNVVKITNTKDVLTNYNIKPEMPNNKFKLQNQSTTCNMKNSDVLPLAEHNEITITKVITVKNTKCVGKNQENKKSCPIIITPPTKIKNTEAICKLTSALSHQSEITISRLIKKYPGIRTSVSKDTAKVCDIIQNTTEEISKKLDSDTNVPEKVITCPIDQEIKENENKNISEIKNINSVDVTISKVTEEKGTQSPQNKVCKNEGSKTILMNMRKRFLDETSTEVNVEKIKKISETLKSPKSMKYMKCPHGCDFKVMSSQALIRHISTKHASGKRSNDKSYYCY